MIQRSLTNGVFTSWIFESAGFLTSLTSIRNGQAIDSHTYQVDALGNITQDTINNLGVTWSYTFDDLYRLTLATLGSANYSWVYDLAGNRISQNAAGAFTSYAYDLANRLIGVNGVPVSYDANGNAIAYGNDVYSWDALDRMTGLTRPGLTASYLYDYSGRRRSVTTNGTATSFVYDGDDIVSEITGGSTISTLHGPFVDDVIQRNALYYTPNHLGSTTTLTDVNGKVAEQYFYFPFGQTWQSAGTSNPFQFTGRENDGTGLDYYRARYYAPDWGRFISEDPIGMDGGLNLFTYGDDDPVNNTDPDGLVVAPWDVVIVLADAGFLIYDYLSGAPSWVKGLDSTAFGIDLGSLLIPFVPCGGGRAFAIAGHAGSAASHVAGAGSGVLRAERAGFFAARAVGRTGQQPRLRELANDPKVSSADRGWIKQEINRIRRAGKGKIRLPINKLLAHRRGFEARKGFSYKYADLQDKDLHLLQHHYEGYR